MSEQLRGQGSTVVRESATGKENVLANENTVQKKQTEEMAEQRVQLL